MNAYQRIGIATPVAANIGRYIVFLLASLGVAIRNARARKAARLAKRFSKYSDQKLTDEMERRIIQRSMRNHSFRL